MVKQKPSINSKERLLLQQLTDCTLDPATFNHQAHIHFTWLVLTKYELDAAIEMVCNTILKYVQHLGAEDKFQHKLTCDAVNLIHNRMQGEFSFEEFKAKNQGLFINFIEALTTFNMASPPNAPKGNK